MINLTEAWKEAYALYLDEEEQKFDERFVELSNGLLEAQNEVKKGFDIIREYFEIYSESEMISESENAEIGSSVSSNGKSTQSPVKSDIGVLKDLMVKLDKNIIKNSADNSIEYEPEVQYSIEKVSDMKFPNNLIFFLKQLVIWVKNVVLYFIGKFSNMIRGLLGKEPKELNSNLLKFKTAEAKKIESLSKKVSMARPAGYLTVLKGDFGDFETIREGFLDDLGIYKKPSAGNDPVNPSTYVVSLDFSKDVEALTELVEHFFNLFDASYGSNNEKLFETSDLEVILNLFYETLRKYESGEPASMVSIGGSATEIGAVSKDRVKQNLIQTNINIEKLKTAYIQTAHKIGQIAKILNSKELVMLTDLGANIKMLSSTTLVRVEYLSKLIPEKYKEAKKLEKALQKMKKGYEKLLDKLNKIQQQVFGISGITYTGVYNRKVMELLDSAKYMTDVVSLRLSGLMLYMRELKEVYEILKLIISPLQK